MLDIVLTLVFSIVMLLFMAFPAMKITEIIEKTFTISPKMHTFIFISLILLFSLMIGIFLKFG